MDLNNTLLVGSRAAATDAARGASVPPRRPRTFVRRRDHPTSNGGVKTFEAPLNAAGFISRDLDVLSREETPQCCGTPKSDNGLVKANDPAIADNTADRVMFGENAPGDSCVMGGFVHSDYQFDGVSSEKLKSSSGAITHSGKTFISTGSQTDPVEIISTGLPVKGFELLSSSERGPSSLKIGATGFMQIKENILFGVCLDCDINGV